MVSCGHTAWRKHRPNFSNSSLQQSLRTSVYVAAIHFPYAAACDEQVVVECRARRFNGLVDFCADCMVVEKARNVYVHTTVVLHAYARLEPLRSLQACPTCSEPHFQRRDPSLNPISFFLLFLIACRVA